MMSNIYFYSFFIYFFILLAIGLFFYKKNRSEKSFLLANRSLNFWVAAISAQSSDMGSWLFLAYPAIVFTHGLIEVWTAVGLVFFMFLNWKIVALKLRNETEKYNSLTLASYFEHKFGSFRLKIISACISIFFFVCYLASGLVGLGRLFEAVFDINYMMGIVIGTLVTVAYILLGGFLAVAWCNLFQGIFLLIMIILVPLVAFLQIGSVEPILQAVRLKNISLSLFPDSYALIKILLLVLGFGLGYFGQPHILVNFMSMKNSSDQVRKATLVGITWQILVLLAALCIGIIAVAFFINKPIENPEHIFVYLVKCLFHPFIGGFVLCAILAASLSTINTQLLVTASNIAQDIYPSIINKKSTDQQIIFISRIATIILAIISMIIAWSNNTSIYSLVLYAWSGLGAAFGPPILHALYAKRLSKDGVIVGMIAGAACSALWPLLKTGIPALIPAFFLNYTLICLIRILEKN